MITNYQTKLLEIEKQKAELKLEKQYTRIDIEFLHIIIALVGSLCLSAGFIIGYLIQHSTHG